jgi:hypothetical protein
MEQVQECQECGREFPTEQALREHVNRDHANEEVGSRGAAEGNPCASCGMDFPTAESLKQHREQAHAGAPAETI